MANKKPAWYGKPECMWWPPLGVAPLPNDWKTGRPRNAWQPELPNGCSGGYPCGLFVNVVIGNSWCDMCGFSKDDHRHPPKAPQWLGGGRWHNVRWHKVK